MQADSCPLRVMIIFTSHPAPRTSRPPRISGSTGDPARVRRLPRFPRNHRRPGRKGTGAAGPFRTLPDIPTRRCGSAPMPVWVLIRARSLPEIRGVPPCLSSSEPGAPGFAEGSVAEQGEQDSDARADEAEEGLGVGLAAGPAAVVVGAEGGVVEGCERGEEHRASQLAVAASGGVYAVDRRTGLFRDRGEARIGGQVGGRKRAAVADGGQQDCGGPDADAGHRGQEPGKRAGLQQVLDPGLQGPELFVDGGQ